MSEDGQTYSAAGEVGQVRLRRTWRERTWIELKKAPPTAWFGMIVIGVYLFVAVFAPIVAPHGEAEVFPVPFAPWDDVHRFGTDQIGRDIYSRLIYGARNTMGIALVTTFLSFLIGGGLGLLAAIARGWIDQLISRFVDVLMAIPSLIFALMLLAVFGSNIVNLIIIIAILDSTRVFRLTRAVSMNVVVMDYVEAAKLRGEGRGWIIFREILPNALSPLVAEMGLRFIFMVLFVSTLSFLGLGVQPPEADWGGIVKENKEGIVYGIPAALVPAIAIATLAISVNLVADWVLSRPTSLKGACLVQEKPPVLSADYGGVFLSAWRVVSCGTLCDPPFAAPAGPRASDLAWDCRRYFHQLYPFLWSPLSDGGGAGNGLAR